MIFGPFEAFLFDQDGIIIDSLNAHVDAWKEIAREFNYTITDHFVKEFAGKPSKVWANEIIKGSGCSESSESIIRRRTEKYKEKSNSISLRQGIIELLKKTKEQNVPVVVVTASGRSETMKILKDHDVLQFFDKIITHEDLPNGRNKPEPDIYLKTAEMLGIEPEKCCVFEDSITGVKAAKSAGMFCISVPDPLLKERNYSISDITVNNFNRIKIKEKEIIIEEI